MAGRETIGKINKTRWNYYDALWTEENKVGIISIALYSLTIRILFIFTLYCHRREILRVCFIQ